METLHHIEPILSPEEETLLEFEALLGAYEDRVEDSVASQEELRARDALIFNGLKKTIESPAAMRNISLLENMSQRLAEMACNHEHFADQLKEHGTMDESASRIDTYSTNADAKAAHASNNNNKPRKNKKKILPLWWYRFELN